MPTDQLPDFVKSFVGKELHLTETSTWGPAAADGSRRGRLVVTRRRRARSRSTPASPLAPPGPGSREVVEGELTAKVPLLGGKIEQAAAPGDRGGHQRRAQRRRRPGWPAERRTRASRHATAGTATARRTGRSPSRAGRQPTVRGRLPGTLRSSLRSMLTRRSSAHHSGADSLARSAPRCARCSRAGRQPMCG